MFAITADQVDSRHDADRGEHALELISRIGADRLALPPDRTSGDEVQALTADARTALELTLALVRTGNWRVGLGIGSVNTPLPESTRTATGGAFIAARTAVDDAKKRPLRVAVHVEPEQNEPAQNEPAQNEPAGPGPAIPHPDSATLQSMLDLLLSLRERRSPEGWELHDLVETGLTQGDAAASLRITPQAASKRAIAAGTRIDSAARTGLAALLAAADAGVGADSTDTTLRSPQIEGHA